ncbi:hypothetical protein [Luteolibacter marinus]|uniref:hypothetical protein n=1 Tax=Luteolibacter marinus TaxID=2776705 RepID=UPI0018695062|nr:hypothetical protein [Luteolibacter marinus]
MTAFFQSWRTKLAVLLLGAALGVAGSRAKPVDEAGNLPVLDTSGRSPLQSRPPSSLDHGASKVLRNPSSLPTEAYSAAWESLKDGKLPRDTRIGIQSTLLAEWAEIDLESALRAAMADPGWLRDDPFLTNPWIDWSPAISRQLDLVWDLIQRHAFGPRTGELRRLWIEAKAKEDPVGLLSHFGELPPRIDPGVFTVNSRDEAVASALMSAHDPGADPNLGFEALSRILEIPEDQGGGHAVQAAENSLPSLSPGTLADRITVASDPAIRALYFDALIFRLRMHEDSLETKLDQWVPAEIRAEVEAGLHARGDR